MTTDGSSDGANSDGEMSATLAALGEALIPDRDAVKSVKSAQDEAEKLTQSAGIEIPRNAALEAALSATRMARMKFPEITFPTLRITEQLRRALEGFATRQALPFEGLHADLPKIQTRWADFLRSWEGVQASVNESILRIAQTIDWDAVLRSIVTAQEFTERRELIAAFRTAALLPAPSMPDDLIDRVLETYREGGGSSAIGNIVSGRYARSQWELLSRVNEDWHEVRYLETRNELLRQSQTAMQGRLYLLVAPALVPHIEGISADFLRSVTGSGKLSHREISSTLAGTVPVYVARQVGTAAVEGFLKFLDEELFAFVDFEKRSPRRPGLNRHVLLHGRDLGQATRMNGVRAFILLDVLGAVVRQVERQASHA